MHLNAMKGKIFEDLNHKSASLCRSKEVNYLKTLIETKEMLKEGKHFESKNANLTYS